MFPLATITLGVTPTIIGLLFLYCNARLGKPYIITGISLVAIGISIIINALHPNFVIIGITIALILWLVYNCTRLYRFRKR